jgi:hypothetical protein
MTDELIEEVLSMNPWWFVAAIACGVITAVVVR